MLWSNSRKGSGRDGCLSLLTVKYMKRRGIWLTVLMRSAHFNSLTHFDVTQQPLCFHIQCCRYVKITNYETETL